MTRSLVPRRVTLLLLAVGACSAPASTGPAQEQGPAAPSDGGGPESSSADTSPPPAADGSDAPIVDAGPGPTPHDAGMTEYDQVAPTPPAQWENVANNLAGTPSECGNVGGVYPDPYADILVAGIALNGLFASTDGAATWKPIGTTGDPIKNRLSWIVWDPDHHDTFWESGIYGWETSTAGVFLTTSGGASFTGYAALSAIQETSDSISVDFSDPQRQTMLAGGHEQKQNLLLSTNAGAAWKDIGASLPAGLGFCSTTLVVDASTLLVGCAASWSGAAGAILRSADGGASWSTVQASGVSGQPLWASDNSIYWGAEGGGIFRSTDLGKTWTEVADASKAGTLRPLELPDGRIASTQGSNLVVSADHGTTWTTIGAPIPFTANGMSYSPFRSAFFAWYFTCSFASEAGVNDVPADSIQRFGWDYRTN